MDKAWTDTYVDTYGGLQPLKEGTRIRFSIPGGWIAGDVRDGYLELVGSSVVLLEPRSANVVRVRVVVD